MEAHVKEILIFSPEFRKRPLLDPLGFLLQNPSSGRRGEEGISIEILIRRKEKKEPRLRSSSERRRRRGLD
jgi:hypothetical protein